MKDKLLHSLLFWVVVAIVLGFACSFFFPDWLARIFVTFNGLFSNFLGFFVPVLIFALIAPAIAGLGQGAGKWLGITAGLAYGSTIISGLIAWGTASALYPTLLDGKHLVTDVADPEAGGLEPYFTVDMPAPLEVMSALLLAFVVGLAMTGVKSPNLLNVLEELNAVVHAAGTEGLTVVDAPLALLPDRCDLAVVVLRPELRAAAAAARIVAECNAAGVASALVLRQSEWASLEPAQVEDTAKAPVIVQVQQVRGLTKQLDQAGLPAKLPRTLNRAAEAVLGEVA